MQAVMSIEQVTNMVPSSITWRNPIAVNQAGDVDHVGPGTSRVSPTESPAGGDDGHLSDGDTPASQSQQKLTRTRFSSTGSPSQGLTSSSSSPNLVPRDQDQSSTLMEATQIIGKQARLQEKPSHSSVGVADQSVMHLVSDSPTTSSPHASRQTLRSRARPRRPEEPPPFLSIDNLPVDKVLGDSKQHSKSRPSSDSRKHTTSSKKRPDPLLNGTGRKTRSPPQSAYTPQMHRSPSRSQSRGTPSATQYNYNSFFTHKSSAFLAGPPNLWSMGNKYWPQHGTPNDRQRLAPLPQSVANETLAPKPNAHVSQPFKHDVDTEVPIDRPVSPSQDLKERTIYALREVTRVLNKQQSPPVSRRGGRLLKGRLKPLHTFKMSGPAVDHCKGIQPEETDYEPSDSRMLQRKRELLSMLPPDIFQPRPLTAESVHRTSIASQLSTERENYLEEQTMKTEEELTQQDQISGGSQVFSNACMPPNSLASLSEDNVYFLQDALTSHIDIPETFGVKDKEDDPQEERSDAQEDQSRIHPISHTYATSYESNSKVDLNSQQTEDVSASGDAPPVIVKDEDEGSVFNEVKATMSDYMNEGGAAMVLSDMVQRVASSAKKSIVDDDGDLDQKYDAYFADSETRSETRTSRTGSSSLGRRRSSMTDSEIDQASCELTDMVSDDGLGEDGSVKHHVKESDLERGSLSTLREESLSMIKNEQTAISETECQSRDDVQTPTNESFQKDNLNVAERLTVENLKGESHPIGEESALVDKKSLENNGISENIERSTSDSVNGELNLETSSVEAKIEPTVNGVCVEAKVEPKVDGICTDKETNDKTGSTDVKNTCEDPDNIQTDMVTDDAPLNANATNTESSLPVESNSVLSEKTVEALPESKADTVVPFEESKDVVPVVTIDVIPTVQIEVTEAEDQVTLETTPDAIIEQDTRQDNILKESLANTDETDIDNIMDDSSAGNEESPKEQNSSLDDENEKVTNEESNEDAQEKTNNSCHDNHVRKDDDKDQDGSQGGSHGNGSGTSNGNNESSNASNEGGSGNTQSDPPSGTDDGSGTQHRTNELNNCCAESISLTNSPNLGNASPKDMLNRREESYEDIEDDVPEIDEAVLFCGLCGLDEDMCLCPHSTFNEKLNSKGHRLTTKSASASVDIKHDRVPHRSFSAAGLLQSRGQNQAPIESWIQQEDEEVSIQNHLIAEYQVMLENPRQGGFSKELISPRDGYMVLQGTGVRCETRQSRARMRLVSSSKSSQPEDIVHQPEERVKSCDTQPDQLEGSVMSDDPLANHNGSFVNGNTRCDDKVNAFPESPEAQSLSVVAKPLSKPRNPKESGQPASLLPAPLCFRINARPPPGYLYYFAYGADMNQNRMTSYLGREADHRLWGVLFGFQLKFNKRGADLEAGGFANIAFSPESSVEGCVYLISPSELRMLDQHVGCPEFYTKAVLPVWMSNCATPDELGVAQYCIPALMYVAQDKWTLQQEDKHSFSSDYSIGQCLKGADLLTPSYLQHISTLRVN
ncbi:uncharacterized protein LOC117303038 [Asterias rubens]|uniref:uncharacterized protein LOC117303038 n=1 Tax=Asterias rubens TaxID=7604 RepID=UPI0014552065|nr:uncharacterized protein LOC117303038 [Asterias rubens]